MTPLCWGIVIVAVVGCVGIGLMGWACCALSGMCDEEEGKD